MLLNEISWPSGLTISYLLICTIAIQPLVKEVLSQQSGNASQLELDINNHNNSKLLPSIDVTNLRLVPELRAVKLIWDYQLDHGSIEPSVFQVSYPKTDHFYLLLDHHLRYCELTSWNDQIKCRTRDLVVRSRPQTPQIVSHNEPLWPTEANFMRNLEKHDQVGSVINKQLGLPVIEQQLKSANKLSSSDKGDHLNRTTWTNEQFVATKVSSKQQAIGVDKSKSIIKQISSTPTLSTYESYIFDLRAQTNYTFQVKVARFDDFRNNNQTANSIRVISSRQLDINGINSDISNEIDELHNNNLTPKTIETKPFGAEATRCLADVSEVIVNTGRYFGGRISVENAVDRRCQMLGNRSSEQTSYLFRIDHELCGSRIIDGNRIETIVLVHENKDILTHNTARFLVLCNFLQKSFTLKASVSLPKINGLLAMAGNSMQNIGPSHSRPAQITPLMSKPGRDMNADYNRLQNQVSSSTLKNGELPIRLGSMPGIYRSTKLQSQHQPQQQQQRDNHVIKKLVNQNESAESNLVIGRQLMNNDDSRNGFHDSIHVLHSEMFPAFNDSIKLEPFSAMKDLSVHSKNEEGEQISPSNNIQISTRSSNQMANLRSSRSGRFEGDNGISWNNFPTKLMSSPSTDSSPSFMGSVSSFNLSVVQPEPVQVQSNVLFIEPNSMQREARQILANGVSLIRAIKRPTTSSNTINKSNINFNSTTIISPQFANNFTTAAAAGNKQSSSNWTKRVFNITSDVDEYGSERSSVSNTTQRALHASLAGSLQQLKRSRASTNRFDKIMNLDSSDPINAAIVLSNNHRVSDSFPSLSAPPQWTTPMKQSSPSLDQQDEQPQQQQQQQQQQNHQLNNNQFSIKYSAVDIDNYSVGPSSSSPSSNEADYQHMTSTTPLTKIHGQIYSTLSPTNYGNQASTGRMGKFLDDHKHDSINYSNDDDNEDDDNIQMNGSSSSSTITSESQINSNPQIGSTSSSSISLNGAGHDDPDGDDEDVTEKDGQKFSLAQNFTNQLLRFSLKTLSNVAKKTVELLAKSAQQQPILMSDSNVDNDDKSSNFSATSNDQKLIMSSNNNNNINKQEIEFNDDSKPSNEDNRENNNMSRVTHVAESTTIKTKNEPDKSNNKENIDIGNKIYQGQDPLASSSSLSATTSKSLTKSNANTTWSQATTFKPYRPNASVASSDTNGGQKVNQISDSEQVITNHNPSLASNRMKENEKKVNATDALVSNRNPESVVAVIDRSASIANRSNASRSLRLPNVRHALNDGFMIESSLMNSGHQSELSNSNFRESTSPNQNKLLDMSPSPSSLSPVIDFREPLSNKSALYFSVFALFAFVSLSLLLLISACFVSFNRSRRNTRTQETVIPKQCNNNAHQQHENTFCNNNNHSSGLSNLTNERCLTRSSSLSDVNTKTYGFGSTIPNGTIEERLVDNNKPINRSDISDESHTSDSYSDNQSNVNNINQEEYSNSKLIKKRQTKYRARPRSHCSSHSDITGSMSTSRESFSQKSLSNGSTTLIGHSENDYRNNELLYTDHVLINLGSIRGESYA